MQLLAQSTAATVLVGPVLDADGAAYTSAVVGDFNLTKNGSTAALASPATAPHSHNGMYLITLTTTNTNTLGMLDISLNKSGYGMTNHRYTVLTADQFAAIVTNGRLLRSTGAQSEVQVTGSNHIAADVHEFQAGVITAGDFAENAITASALAADAVAEIQSGLATTAGLTEIKGAGWSSSTDTLEKIAESSGGSTVSISIPAATAQTVLDSTTAALALYRGTTFSYQFTGLGTMTTWSKVYFTVRPVKKTADAQSLIQIVVTNPSDGADGLKYLNGAATTASWGSIVVDNTSTGSITVTIKPNATTLLAEQYGVDYDVKVILSDSTIPILAFGTLSVIPDVTRAIT